MQGDARTLVYALPASVLFLCIFPLLSACGVVSLLVRILCQCIASSRFVPNSGMQSDFVRCLEGHACYCPRSGCGFWGLKRPHIFVYWFLFLVKH